MRAPRSALKPVWRPEELTADWLTAALRSGGLLGDASVRRFSVEPVGTGQMGDSFRICFEPEPPDRTPRSIVGKFTAADEQSRSTGVSMRTSEVEVRFYQEVAPTLPARTAACYYADVDPASARFVLLLEDLAPRAAGDQVAGCTLDEAALALEELAKVHAPRWGDPSLEQLDWLNRRDRQSLDVLTAIFPHLWTGFAERYHPRLSEQVVRVGDAFFPRIGEYLNRQEKPCTVQHADYRVDNLLFGGPADSPLAIVDWQTVTVGPGAADVAYFMGGSLPTEMRHRNERELLSHYLEVAATHGLQGYTFDDLWLDYRRHAYSGLIMAVGAAMMVARTERGDDMFLAMAHRHAAHVEDMEALSLLGD
jgi:hypothetical protein